MIHWSKKSSTPQLDLLVLAAHPDDAELMCAGTLALLSSTKKVGVIDVTMGELSTNGDLPTREKERDAATEVMQLDARGNLKRADGQLYKDGELTEVLTLALRVCSPKVVIGPPSPCRHPDHQALSEALSKAIFYCGLKKFLPDTAHIQRPKHYQYLEVQDTPPDFCIDISKVWEQKLQAIMAYQSQFNPKGDVDKTFINSGFVETLEQRFKHYGNISGVDYAEPYLSPSPICISDPAKELF